MNYAHLLQDLRRGAGMSQAEAAELLGFASYNGVSRLENGLHPVNPQVQRLLLLWQQKGVEALRALRAEPAVAFYKELPADTPSAGVADAFGQLLREQEKT